MDLVNNLGAAEVLSHLEQLGYTNITPEELKQFLKDLKKLIIHDQMSARSCSNGSLTSLSSTDLSDSEYYSASDTLTSMSGAKLGHQNKDKKKLNKYELPKAKSQVDGLGIKPNVVRQSVSSSSICSSGSSISTRLCRTYSSCLPSSRAQKENQPLNDNLMNIQEALKPKTSFIRPWQLQGATGPSRAGRSDPVSLYHYYLNLWAQRKCPGEDPHTDLRWVIREKMLGQNPRLCAPSFNDIYYGVHEYPNPVCSAFFVDSFLTFLQNHDDVLSKLQLHLKTLSFTFHTMGRNEIYSVCLPRAKSLFQVLPLLETLTVFYWSAFDADWYIRWRWKKFKRLSLEMKMVDFVHHRIDLEYLLASGAGELFRSRWPPRAAA